MNDPGPKKRVTGEALMARDACWLEWHREGRTVDQIAEDAGFSRQLVNRALRRAEAAAAEAEATPVAPRASVPAWLDLVPLFPIGPFTPSSQCPHNGPIREGSLLACMVCGRSGMDGHPALRRDPASDPRPEPTAIAEPDPEPTAVEPAPKLPETRRERRRRTFGEARPAA